ncbi:flagellar protein FlaG [Candidatus Thermokryptus mobilis]|uniref:Flagellar protein FlaG n=1 Tax=Candidatus Thermokryptus mobilis TaxID=1643428 RepID=A0A0S4N2Z1_9BACT|nr:flagellar protein FlaG [Candidatus Thermokryptus mobilis]CUU05096.1 flagellar protein FlaG [Candidatus Thermokryptus mobilis]
MIGDVKNINATKPVQVEQYDISSQSSVDVQRVSQSERGLSTDEIEQIVSELNNFIQIFNTKIAFEIDKETRKTVLKIIDAQSNEIIRQIPPEELLEISRRISELLGLIINAKV